MTDIAISERSREDPEIQAPYNSNTMHVQCKNKMDTGNNRGDWNHFKIVQTVPEQHTGENTKLRTFFRILMATFSTKYGHLYANQITKM